MPFLPNDIYTASGDVSLFNHWTENVTKFDTSSFYNWEQDNLPVFDLEERTYLLWEKEGFPTSSVPGLALTVSATATAADLTCNPNLFTTVSGAIAALPNVLRFPVLIEVASFGELGTLEISNLKVEGAGSLEIINRAFSKVYSASSTAENVTTSLLGDWIHSVKSLDTSNTFAEASAVHIGEPVLTSDSQLDENRIVWQIPGYETASMRRTSKLTVAPKNSSIFTAGAANVFDADIYDDDATYDATVSSHDVSAFNEGIGSTSYLARKSGAGFTADSTKITGMVYGNWLTQLSIENCEGPIIIRHFFIDGTTGNGGEAAFPQGREVGAEIVNSDVWLENLSVAQCSEAGLLAINSKVLLSRGFVAYRNYKLTSATVRDTKTLGAGLRAVNSTINLEHLDSTTSSVDFLVHASQNDIGFDLQNSVLEGGDSRGITWEDLLFLQTSYNQIGVKLQNSHMSVDGRLDIWNNGQGAVLDNSELRTDEVTVEYQKKEGIHSTGSIVTYNKDKTSRPDLSVGNQAETNANVLTQSFYKRNSQHMVLDGGSTLRAEIVDDMPTNTGRLNFIRSHGTNTLNEAQTTVPSISVLNNSNATLVHTRIETSPDSSEGFNSNNKPVYGAGIAATNEASILFQGSKEAATIILGPTSYLDQVKAAGVYSDVGSVAEFNGPTLVGRFGVDVLAENNSTMTFRPHTKENGNMDVSGWNLLDTGNHTSVELHSTRACLVANKNSTLNMTNLGDINASWPDTLTSSIDLNTADNNVSSYMSAGSMQFYPSPQDSVSAIPNPTIHSVSEADPKFDSGSYSNGVNINYGFLDPDVGEDNSPMDNVTGGGVCVRLVEGSVGDVQNVHFPAGYEQVSSVLFDASGDCTQLYIWNVAQDSNLTASYCSVSGTYPSLAPYLGPDSVWVDSGGTAVSGAPSSTPNTASLSVLDAFGSGEHAYSPLKTDCCPSAPMSSTKTYGFASPLNRGVFRLFFSTKPEAKDIMIQDGGGTWVLGAAPQIYAQGYNVSADVSASPSTSSLHLNLVNYFDYDNDGVFDAIETSGFYYCNEFVNDAYDRVIIDESGSNTFANSKNAALGTSNRPKLVSIYRAVLTETGEAFSSDNVGFGAGYKSSTIFDLDREN